MKNIENIKKIRSEFPFLKKQVGGRDLVYFDNAATSQKPQAVIDALVSYYENSNSNVHRGAHTTSREATDMFERARKTVQRFINAASTEEIIFTKGTTESINLVAHAFGKKCITSHDEIILGSYEHHSNMVPWHILAKEKQASIKIIPITEDGELDFEGYKTLLNGRVKIVAINHISNALGTLNPIKKFISEAHKHDIKVLIDGAQGVPHLHVDVQNIGADFYAFSGHKMYAPTGIGVLYGKKDLLNQLPPYQGGGEMIKNVEYTKTEYNVLPFKFEAGTPNIADTIALEAAINFIEKTGYKNIQQQENNLYRKAIDGFKNIQGIRIYGSQKNPSSLVSFNIDGVHSYDLGMILDQMGIAVRTGHHCAQPIMDYYKIPGTVRVSYAVYNTIEEVEYFFQALNKALAMLRK